MISPQTIDEIRNKVDIVSVVSEYVRLRKTGKNYVGLCPFHSEKTPSFTVSPEKQLFHCFGCGEGGNVFTFVMKSENISFTDAVKELGAKVGITVESTTPPGTSSKSEKDKLYEVALLAAKFFRKCFEEESGKSAREYLKQRGISEQSAKVFGLGFSPEGWDNLFKHLVCRGVAPALIERAGLTLPREGKDGYYDRFRNRLIFPIIDLRGRMVAFSGRTLKDEEPTIVGEPKYLNSPDTPIYHKGETIFGLNLSKESVKEKKTVVLVEGNLDLLAAYQAGVTNVAAPLGTALTVYQCKLLARFAEAVVLAFDSDSAGSDAAERSVELLRAQELKVKVVELMDAKDPDELICKSGPEAFKKAVASALPFLEFKIKRALARHDLSAIEDRSRALREVAGILSREKDPFVQKEYAKLVAGALKIDPETILTEARRQGYYSRSPEKDLRRMTEKPASKIAEAEKNLVALALQDKNFWEITRREMRVEDFSLPETRMIAELLFSPELDQIDAPAHLLMEKIPDESARKFLSGILVSESPRNSEKVLRDCIQTIKNEHLGNRIKALKMELKRAEEKGEAQKVAELLTALRNEIS